jgi:pyruvate dehydrogenase E2 component (dihydrolipoamide acetyltransferase)
MRQAIAGQMARSAAVPQFQLMREVVLEKIGHTGEGPKPTYTDIVLWATAQALKHTPAVNASWVDGEPPSVRVHPQVNLGVAVAVEEGLIVPVIPDAAALSLMELAVARRRVEAAVRAGRLRSDQLQGGTFTVSNLGGEGVDEFIALVNPPEAGILAVGAVKPRPIVADGKLVAASTVRLTLSGDHRVFDGMEGARFLGEIASQLQFLAKT